MQDKIRRLVDEELIRANEQYGRFCSTHEATAVLLEEIEEAEENLKFIKERYATLWENVKDNTSTFIPAVLSTINALAIGLSVEAVQVAAMCRKFQTYLDESDGR